MDPGPWENMSLSRISPDYVCYVRYDTMIKVEKQCTLYSEQEIGHRCEFKTHTGHG